MQRKGTITRKVRGMLAKKKKELDRVGDNENIPLPCPVDQIIDFGYNIFNIAMRLAQHFSNIVFFNQL